MMRSSWRLARSLEVLRSEVNAIAPRRSRVSDGTIGDARHRATASDHNPNSAGVVCALDLTHDPASGADMARISEHIRTHRHPALKYVIFNRRIASAASGWAWRAYSGSNPHTAHMHVSVGVGPDGRSTGPYDSTSPWGLTTRGGISAMLGMKKGDRGDDVRWLQIMLNQSGFSPGALDGIWGDKTSAALLALRQSIGSKATSGDTLSPDALEQLLRVHAMRFAAGKPGPAGPQGPQGPPGPKGDPGEVDEQRVADVLLGLLRRLLTAARG